MSKKISPTEISPDQDLQAALTEIQELLGQTESDINLIRKGDLAGKIAMLHIAKENFPEARQFFLVALDVFSKTNDHFKKASVQGAIGSLHLQLGEYDLAKRYTELAYEYWLKSTYLNERIACLQNLGQISFNLNDEEKAVDYLLNAVRMSMQLEDEDQFALSIQILLEFYEQQERYDLLKELKIKALEFWQSLGVDERIFKTAIDLGVICQILEQFEESVQFFKRGFNVGYQLGDLKKMYLAQGFIAETYFKLRDLENAKLTYLETFKLASYIHEMEGIKSEFAEKVEQMRVALLSLGMTQEELKKNESLAREEAKKK